MSPDLIEFGAKVLERALQQSGYMPPHIYEPGEARPHDDAVVDGLAQQLIKFVIRLDKAYAAPELQAGLVSELEAGRNERLARALGACMCLGESLTCVKCGGRGRPGWQLPERAEFEALVRPALLRISNFRNSYRNGHLNSQHATRRSDGRNGLAR